MNKSFLPNDDIAPQPSRDRSSAADSLLPDFIPARADREPVQILVIGSEPGITSIIHTLHLRDFAAVYERSCLLPAPVQGKLMSTLTRYISMGEARSETIA